jgi:Rrf2 family nitric oxide-sensitive transcriptional repressor
LYGRTELVTLARDAPQLRVSGRVLDAAGVDATDLGANVAPAMWSPARVYPCGGPRSVRSLQEKPDQACASLTRLHADAFVHPAPGRDTEASLLGGPTMQLTAFTDYALRMLMGLGAVAPEKLTVGQLSAAYGISVHHLLKVANELAALGYVETIRGKSGGVRLAKSPEAICIGVVVRAVEPELGVVPCLRTGDAPCIIASACRLKRVLAGATDRFVAELDRHTLADLLEPRQQLQRLLQLAGDRGPARDPEPAPEPGPLAQTRSTSNRAT